MLPYLQGIGIGGGLIIAIGAQNAFVLSQGVHRNFPVQTAIVCSLGDGLLIFLGVSGIGTLVASHPLLAQLATWFGALFLLCYGFRSFRAAIQGGSLDATTKQIPSRRQLFLATLALTFLNPHAYLDTFVLIGGLSGELALADRYLFGAGATTASILWFFSLSLGAGFLAPLFRKQLAWRLLDGFVCLTMWGIATSLLWPKLQPYLS
ncbi:L-lysine exporter family protein LysE/ArgO [Desulfuromusa kysingii]|uniref:L-lysine exporter family protein LysE/ArgO n=1 Tax=Desulfuromusa kysingii TaxID=37625 RepID=A0A1H4DH53_9BACT|nr:LysE family transporter [Desulfuromusa kysingii]SEA71760.1 L-lysine exporter family protein LysE/ArgO [Desulfuromusa kysingii]